MRRSRYPIYLSLLVCPIIIYWLLTTTQTNEKFLLNFKEIDIKNGEAIFFAGGCGSCHYGPDNEILSGGQPIKTKFGTFYSPNISSDPKFGIGSWTLNDFAYALKKGVSPEGKHYFPVFPYTSYAGMTLGDIADLKSYLETQPPSKVRNKPHDINLLYSIRQNIGIWKILNRSFKYDDVKDISRGEYLVNHVSHCGECHTERNFFGVKNQKKYLMGAQNFNLRENSPNITSTKNGLKNWSEEDLIYYLETGFTPDYDTVGGSMVKVIENLSQIRSEELVEIAKYLKSLTDE